jgi:hypothetical protein
MLIRIHCVKNGSRIDRRTLIQVHLFRILTHGPTTFFFDYEAFPRMRQCRELYLRRITTRLLTIVFKRQLQPRLEEWQDNLLRTQVM